MVSLDVILFLTLFTVGIHCQIEEEFSPNVEPSCEGGYMSIKVNVNTPYNGVVYTLGHREEPCMVKGDGKTSVTLRLPLITDETKPDYCGVRLNQTTKEKYVVVYVRLHDMLELADDKTYKIRCGLQGYIARNETNFVDFALLDPAYYRMASTAVFDKKYILRGKILGPDRSHVLRVRECFAFDEGNTSLQLTDYTGCPVHNAISTFNYNDTEGTADATIDRMFKFQDSNRVNFQCDVFICQAPCNEDMSCVGRPQRLIETSQEGRSYPQANSIDGQSGRVQAGTSVYVVPPGSDEIGMECEYYPPWLWILCIALAVLFIIMMIINIFLCSAMTCSCTKTEVIEKEPSIIEEYDPYRSWHGSQYGSRYSLNGKGYTSGASTMNSARSVSSHSDHYAIVHSRPDSRYSGHHSMKEPRMYKAPPSTNGSHYSHHRMG